MKRAFTLCALMMMMVTMQAQTKTKFTQDREAILAMAGCYTVTFDFAETFAPDTAYKYHDRYHTAGLEYVFVLEDTEKKIALQHLLIVNDTMVIKHWRQEWFYENAELLTYTNSQEWKTKKLSADAVKGQWTQKVFQVDDGPRYEGNGTWIHADGRHFWQSVCDAPLPRRENTKREDYNIMRRHSHVEITADGGWYIEQDNEKVQRDSTYKDKLLCWEKGMERFSKTSESCDAAVNYWEKNKAYWADVRAVWGEVYAKHPKQIKMHENPGDSRLWYKLIRVARDTENNKDKDRKAEIRAAIESFIKG